MGKLIVYGNCQSAALYEVLKATPEVTRRWTVVHHELWASGAALEQALAHFDDCDVLVRQDLRNWRTHPRRDLLPPHTRIVDFPFCYIAALWPFDGHQNGNDPGWRFGEGDLKFAFTDRLLGRLRETTPDPETRFARYRDLNAPDLPDIARYAEFEEARLLREDRRIGSTLGRFIVDHYRTTRLFHTITHPTPLLIRRLADEVLAKLGLAPLPEGRDVPDYLGYFQVPLHPEVIRALALTWTTPGADYKFSPAERLTFEQYIRRYIRVYG